MTETGPVLDDDLGQHGDFQTANVVTIAGGHAVHDTFTAFLPPLLPYFVEKLSGDRRLFFPMIPLGDDLTLDELTNSATDRIQILI